MITPNAGAMSKSAARYLNAKQVHNILIEEGYYVPNSKTFFTELFDRASLENLGKTPSQLVLELDSSSQIELAGNLPSILPLENEREIIETLAGLNKNVRTALRDYALKLEDHEWEKGIIFYALKPPTDAVVAAVERAKGMPQP